MGSTQTVEFQNILTLFFLGLTLAAPLGPVNAEMIKKTLARLDGWKQGIITGLGASSGDFIIAMTVLFLGAEVLVQFLGIKWMRILLLSANVLILGYIGINSLRADIKEVEVEDNDTSWQHQYRMGLFLVITSPWSYAWWASFGPVMLDLGIPLTTFINRLEATMYFIVGILFWVVIFNLGLKISHSFASPKFLKAITMGSALVLLVFALKILLDIFCILFSWCLF